MKQQTKMPIANEQGFAFGLERVLQSGMTSAATLIWRRIILQPKMSLALTNSRSFWKRNIFASCGKAR